MSSRIDEVRERLARGESWTDVAYGPGWEQRFPHFKTVYSLAGCMASSSGGVDSQCSFRASIRTGGSWQSITNEMLAWSAKGVTKQEALALFDEVCRQWLEDGGQQRVQPLKHNWIADPIWHQTYPELSSWIARGKRYCMEVKFNLDGTAKIKAWFYNKPANRELVLVDEATSGDRELVLHLLNQRVAEWLRQNPIPTISPEDDAALQED